LRADEGNRCAAAEKLGISPRTLRYKLAQMRKAGVTIPDDILRSTSTNQDATHEQHQS